jgi:hypothetical protein
MTRRPVEQERTCQAREPVLSAKCQSSCACKNYCCLWNDSNRHSDSKPSKDVNGSALAESLRELWQPWRDSTTSSITRYVSSVSCPMSVSHSACATHMTWLHSYNKHTVVSTVDSRMSALCVPLQRLRDSFQQ